jgi:hypothetical protein
MNLPFVQEFLEVPGCREFHDDRVVQGVQEDQDDQVRKSTAWAEWRHRGDREDLGSREDREVRVVSRKTCTEIIEINSLICINFRQKWMELTLGCEQQSS